jgi:flagellar protein FliO/FliZ
MDTQSLLIAALVLAGLCAALLAAPRLLRGLGLDPTTRPGRRLAIVEIAAIDPRRRLVLARCDRTEVLLLVGGNTETVVGWLPPGPPPGAPAASPTPIALRGAPPPNLPVDDLA